MIDLKYETDSYLYGLLLADGNLSLYSRNRGRVSIELNSKDGDILYKLNEIYGGIIYERKRKTNFLDEINTIIWCNNKLEFRQTLLNFGFPSGNKSLSQSIPNCFYDEKGFWRGYIDGNGSFGFTNDGYPFLSIATQSENIKNEWQKFLLKFNIIRKTNKNLRDNFYNIRIIKNNCQEVLSFIYSDSFLFIDRKENIFQKISNWEGKALKNRKIWDINEDHYILEHPLEESVFVLKRSASSIKNRMFRIKHLLKGDNYVRNSRQI